VRLVGGALLVFSFCAGCEDSKETAGAGGAAASSGSSTATSGATATTAGSSTASSSTGAGGSFALEVHTVLDAEPGLVLEVNLPFAVSECLDVPGDPPCADLDDDDIVDAWEDAALSRLRPMLRLDEDESLVGDATAVVGDVGRVTRSGDLLQVHIMLGYSKDYGSCGGFTSHNGDSERVALQLVPLSGMGPGDVRVSKAYTAAHEGTANDHGRVFTGPELAELVHAPDPETGEPRWVVFPSADKHATYATIAICEGISVVPCFEEDCAPDGVSDPSTYDLLPPYVNAGEEAAPLVTDLAVIGFGGDDAWADQDFCGGLGGSSCSSSVREKLTVDPF
jgi:hypothetical protein